MPFSFQDVTYFRVQYPHEFIVCTCLHYKNNNIQLQPEISRTLDNMVTEIYDDLNGIDNVRIDMLIYDTENVQAPSVFQCILKSGESAMLITIKNDGTKIVKFPQMSEKSQSYGFLKSLTHPTICALIGGSVGYIIYGCPGSILGAGVGFVAKDKVVERVLNYVDKQAILHEQ